MHTKHPILEQYKRWNQLVLWLLLSTFGKLVPFTIAISFSFTLPPLACFYITMNSSFPLNPLTKPYSNPMGLLKIHLYKWTEEMLVVFQFQPYGTTRVSKKKIRNVHFLRKNNNEAEQLLKYWNSLLTLH